ncbi:MAG: hypothetical protein SFZ24_08865 [Planctomycetota bacterium]|nr:hypothetical protein [Planctomycetota bacterium]
MGLTFAIEELYATGWSTLESTGCEFDADGRLYPTVARIAREFADAGYALQIRRIDLFDCCRAEWRAPSGEASGAVVGQSEAEAAVYALAHFRRLLITA